jgi:hypothetical protein
VLRYGGRRQVGSVLRAPETRPPQPASA